jgi:hypothetical protein
MYCKYRDQSSLPIYLFLSFLEIGSLFISDLHKLMELASKTHISCIRNRLECLDLASQAINLEAIKNVHVLDSTSSWPEQGSHGDPRFLSQPWTRPSNLDMALDVLSESNFLSALYMI